MTNTEDRPKLMAQFHENVVLTPEFQSSINEARRIRAAQQLGQMQQNYGLVQSRMQNKTAQESATSQRAVLAHDLQLRRDAEQKNEGFRRDYDTFRALKALYHLNPDPPTSREWEAAKRRFKEQGSLTVATESELDAGWAAQRTALKQEAGNAARAVEIFNRESVWLRDPANKTNPDYAKRNAANEELRKQLEGRVGLFDTSTGRMESMARGPREDPIEPRQGPGAAPQFGAPGPTPSPAPEPAQPKTSFWDGFGKTGTAVGGAFDQFFGSLGGGAGGSRSTLSPSFPPPSYQEPPNTGQPFMPGYNSTDDVLRPPTGGLNQNFWARGNTQPPVQYGLPAPEYGPPAPFLGPLMPQYGPPAPSFIPPPPPVQYGPPAPESLLSRGPGAAPPAPEYPSNEQVIAVRRALGYKFPDLGLTNDFNSYRRVYWETPTNNFPFTPRPYPPQHGMHPYLP